MGRRVGRRAVAGVKPGHMGNQAQWFANPGPTAEAAEPHPHAEYRIINQGVRR